MTELIIIAQDMESLVTMAAELGYYDPKTHKLTTQGDIATGGSYFFNGPFPIDVPTGATALDKMGNPQPVMQTIGIGGRLRHNGDPKDLPAIPPTFGVTIYAQVTTDAGTFWSADGSTPADGYVGTIGVIA